MNTSSSAASLHEHPLAGTRMSGADVVVQVLADERVETIFGYSGGAILPTYDAVFRFNDKHRRADGKAAIVTRGAIFQSHKDAYWEKCPADKRL